MRSYLVSAAAGAGVVALVLGCGGDDGLASQSGPDRSACNEAASQTFAEQACITVEAGCAFTNLPIASAAAVQVVQLEVKAGAPNLDAVIGVARGDASVEADLAAAVRLSSNGTIEARDGGTYGADTAIAYVPGQPVELRMVIDIASATYSVFVSSPGSSSIARLASRYRFEPARGGVASLDRLAIGSIAGSIEACRVAAGPRPGLLSVRDGNYDVLPLGGGGALISSGSRTTRIDGAHRDVAAVDVGGEVSIDAAGNLYIARLASGQLEVHSFTPSLAPRWNVGYPVSDAGSIGDMVVANTGEIAVVLSGQDPNGNDVPLYLVRLAATGALVASDPLPAGTTAIGLSTTQYVIARAVDTGVVFESYLFTYLGEWSWMTATDGNFRVGTVAVAPDGSFAIAGRLGGPVAFGTTTVEPYLTPDGLWDAFVAGFSPAFVPQFAHRRYTEVRGLSTDGSRIAVADERWTQLQTVHVTVYDASGAELRTWSDDALVGNFGYPGEIAIAPGRLYTNVQAALRGPTDERWPFLVTLGL